MSRVLAALLVVGALLLTQTSWRRKTWVKQFEEVTLSDDRFVDAGIVLHVVVADPKGTELISGKPPVRIVRTHRFGGTIDTKAVPPCFVGRSQSPVVWYCSEQQEAVIVHSGNPLGVLCYGSEGAGKTRALAMWHAIRWLEHLGENREGGQTAPTNQRLELIRREMFACYPSHWYKYRGPPAQMFTFCDGTRIKLVSTHRQSEAQGSPIQGFNWSWCGRDEAQDQLHVHEDIESRGRAARVGPDGTVNYRQLATATAKDDPEWRSLRDVMIASGQWEKHELSIFRSPFVGAAFLQSKASSMSPREFRRRYGDPLTGRVEDLAPESSVYFGWDRKHNLRPAPVLGAKRITSIVLRAKTGNSHHDLLVGHDPGTAKAASIFLDAYQMPGEPDPCWWVRAELFTLHQTTEQHALEVLKIARTFGCNKGRIVNGQQQGPAEIAHIRAQPVGQSSDKPDLDVYRVFARVGLDIRAAQYKMDGTGTGHIAKDSRIEMVNRLLCDAAGRRRLFVDVDAQGKPVAPKLVEAFETMERDHRGRAEHEAKDKNDPSDPPAALGYALWPFEKEAAKELRATTRRNLV